MSAFRALQLGLPRERPAQAFDVNWACDAAGIGADAAICDAACGPGAGLPELRRAAPDGRIIAFDRHLPFLAEARAEIAAHAPLSDRALNALRVVRPA